MSFPVFLFQLMGLWADVRSRDLTTDSSRCDTWLWTSRHLRLWGALTLGFFHGHYVVLVLHWPPAMQSRQPSNPQGIADSRWLQFQLPEWMRGSVAKKSAHVYGTYYGPGTALKGVTRRHINSFDPQNSPRRLEFPSPIYRWQNRDRESGSNLPRLYSLTWQSGSQVCVPKRIGYVQA